MIFFDLDNTLIDHNKSERLAILKLCKTLQVHGDSDEISGAWQQISKQYYQQYLSKSITFEEQRILRIRDFLTKLNAIDSNNHPIKIDSLSDIEIRKIFDSYLQLYESNWCIYEDVLPLLESLGNTKLGIITNGQTSQQLKKLESTSINKYFSLVITSHDAGVSKPDYKLFMYAAQKAKVPIKDCHYIGDDLENDAVAAYKSGMHGYWINRQGSMSVIPNNNIIMLKSLCEAIDIFLPRK